MVPFLVKTFTFIRCASGHEQSLLSVFVKGCAHLRNRVGLISINRLFEFFEIELRLDEINDGYIVPHREGEHWPLLFPMPRSWISRWVQGFDEYREYK